MAPLAGRRPLLPGPWLGRGLGLLLSPRRHSAGLRPICRGLIPRPLSTSRRLDTWKRSNNCSLTSSSSSSSGTTYTPEGALLPFTYGQAARNCLKNEEILGDQIQTDQKHACSHPELVIINPMESVKKSAFRPDQFKILRECLSGSSLGNLVAVPNSCQLNGLESRDECLALLARNNVEFPIICKPIAQNQHEMTILFKPTDLENIKVPVFIQSFINHGAVLFKLFVVGTKYWIVRRPSLRNLQKSESKDPIIFNSVHISSSRSVASELTACPESSSIDEEICDQLVPLIRSRVKLDLFGLDVIVNCEAKDGRQHEKQQYTIVDINVFPGFAEIKDFGDHLERFIFDKINKIQS